MSRKKGKAETDVEGLQKSDCPSIILTVYHNEHGLPVGLQMRPGRHRGDPLDGTTAILIAAVGLLGSMGVSMEGILELVKLAPKGELNIDWLLDDGVVIKDEIVH